MSHKIQKLFLFSALLLILSTIIALGTMDKANAQVAEVMFQQVSLIDAYNFSLQSTSNASNVFSASGTVAYVEMSLQCNSGSTCLSDPDTWGVSIATGSGVAGVCVSDRRSNATWGVGVNGSPNTVIFPMTEVGAGGCALSNPASMTTKFRQTGQAETASPNITTNTGAQRGGDSGVGPYIIYYTEGQFAEAFSTQILNFDVSGFESLGTSITFTAEYISNTPAPDEICIIIDDIGNYQTLVPICDDITQTGNFTFATTTTMASSTYRAYAQLNAGDQILDISNSEVFTVGTINQSYVPEDSGWGFGNIPAGTSSTSTLSELTLECDPNDGFFARSVCNVAVLLFVPSRSDLQQLDANLGLVFEKQPFSAYVEFRNGWNTAVKNPDTESTGLTLTFYGASSTIISVETFESVVGPDGWALMRGLMGIALWIALAWFMFNRVTKLFS